MKRVIIYILIILLICFAIPIVFSRKFVLEEASAQNINKQEEKSTVEENYNYNQYNTIRLYHAKTNEIEELNLDEYLLRCSIC